MSVYLLATGCYYVSVWAKNLTGKIYDCRAESSFALVVLRIAHCDAERKHKNKLPALQLAYALVMLFDRLKIFTVHVYF